MGNGYIKLYRKILDNPIIMKDSEHLAVWIYLLVEATHKEMDALFKGKRITLQPGQLITGTKSIGMKLKINYLKVYRILNEFESEKQIEKQTSNRNSIITINNWCIYQDSEKQTETLLKNNCKTTETLLKTNKNDKNDKNTNNGRNNIYIVEIIDHLNLRTGLHYKTTTNKTVTLINARLKEGFTVDDFKTVIDKMCVEWMNTDMQKYLRPETLFGTKFESYLNREVKQTTKNMTLSSEEIKDLFG